MFQRKNRKENQNIFFAQIFFSENCAVYETMWRNVVEPEATEENIKRDMRSAWWITMATDTSSVCVMLIDFQWQTLLLSGAAYKFHTFIACLVGLSKRFTLTSIRMW